MTAASPLTRILNDLIARGLFSRDEIVLALQTLAPVGRNPEGGNEVPSRSDEHAVGEAEAPEHHRETSTD